MNGNITIGKTMIREFNPKNIKYFAAGFLLLGLVAVTALTKLLLVVAKGLWDARSLLAKAPISLGMGVGLFAVSISVIALYGLAVSAFVRKRYGKALWLCAAPALYSAYRLLISIY